MPSYFDKDTLLRKYGPDKATAQKGGEYVTDGQYREVEVRLNLAALTQAELVQIDTTVIPAGVKIMEVRLQTMTAAATGVAIDVGLVRTDRTTEIDFDGILAAHVTASMTPAGKTTVFNQGSTQAGALFGATLTNPGYITASATTSTFFTAGDLIMTIRYIRP